jgi:hypothetical protein
MIVLQAVTVLHAKSPIVASFRILSCSFSRASEDFVEIECELCSWRFKRGQHEF